MYINGNQPQNQSHFYKKVADDKLARGRSNPGMTRQASMFGFAGGAGGSGQPLATLGGGQVSRMAMKPFSPLYQESNLMLPKDRKTMNAYNRHYYETDYWVGNIIDLHTYYPLGGFDIISKNKQLEKLMIRAADKVDLLNIILGIGLEYWVYGEAFPFLEWDKQTNMWSRATIFNPDLMEVRRTIFMDKPIISLIPDAELKRIATSTHPADAVLRMQIPQSVLEYVLKGENIPLSSRNVSHILKKTVPHDLRGTSIIQRVWKELMLRDAFREVLFVIAQNHITPLKIFKIGGKDKEYWPNQDDLAVWQGIIEEAQNDPNFSIITHEALEVEYKGFNGQILDVAGYFDQIQNNVLTGLFASKAVTTSEGPSYSNAQVAYEILQKRYVYFRNVIERWLNLKFFLPLSMAHGFKKPNDAGYDVPQIKWSRMDFNKDDAWRNKVIELNNPEHKLLADRTVVTEMGFDYDEQQELIAAEKAARLAAQEKAKEEKKDAPGGAGGMGGIPGLGGGGGDLGGLGGGGLEGLGGAPGAEGGAPGAPGAPGAEGGAPAAFSTPEV